MIFNELLWLNLWNSGAYLMWAINFIQALSNTKAESANFLFCTIEPNVGLVSVPDRFT